MRFMSVAARLISAVFSPIIMPTYAVALGIRLTYLYTLPVETVWSVIGWTFGFTAIAPVLAIFVMMKLGIVTDSGLNKQGERMWPYIITSLCYIGCALFLRHLHAPAWLYMFAVGGAIVSLINMAVNFRWKISGHGAGMGGMVAMLIFLAYHGLNAWPMEGWIFAGLIAAGLTGTARLILERHTLMQVAAGFANGFICVWAALSIAF